MKHDQLAIVGGALQGLHLPTSAESKPGAIYIDDRFLMYRDSTGLKDIEIMDGNDYVEWISFLGRTTVTPARLVNVRNNAAAVVAVGTTDPKVNSSYQVSSNTQFMSAYMALNVTLTTQDFTFECWRRTNTNGGSISYPHDIISCQGGLLRFGWRSEGQFWLRYGPSMDILAPLGVAPTVNEWHHVAFEREGTMIRIYLNGTMIHSVDTPVLNVNAPSATFGAGYTQSMPTTHLDEIVITRIAKYKGARFVPKSRPIVLNP